MFDKVKKAIPSMYIRRLLLLAACAFVVAVLLVVQTAHLTVVQAETRREKAERALIDGYLIQTIRGRIVDRKGRVLAVDKPSSDLAVPYSIITGSWSYSRAYLDARRANLERWRELSPEERERLVAGYLPAYEQQLEQFWRTVADTGRTSLDEIDRKKVGIVSRVQAMAAHVWLRQQKRREAELNEPVALADVAREIEEQRSNHVILQGLDTPAVLAFQRLIAEGRTRARVRDARGRPVYNEMAVWANVEIAQSATREYPNENFQVEVDRRYMPTPLRSETPLLLSVQGVGTHLVGSLRRAIKSDVDNRPFIRNAGKPDQMVDLSGYLGDDLTGEFGVERSEEERLRGARGRVIVNLESGHEDRREPIPGEDVQLTVDIALQARIQALMDPGSDVLPSGIASTGLMRVQPFHAKDPEANPLRPQAGQALNGAAVVLEIRSGDVLAAVSMPSMQREVLRQTRASIFEDQINQPWINRPVQMQYMPGSTVKPLVYCAAVSEGLIAHGAHIECKGHLHADKPGQFRCWIFKSFNQVHGSLTPQEALAYSCNIYFYELGRRFGPERISNWYRRFGLGGKLGVGLVEEIPGVLPRPEDMARFNQADATFLGIGQGPIQATPIQIANAFATMSRGGMHFAPSIVARQDDPSLIAENLRLSRHAIADAEEGLFGSSNWDHGTTHHLSLLGGEKIFNVPGVVVAGKSGTADAVPLRIDSDNDGRITTRDTIVRQGDHAWFVGLVKKSGDREYRYVVAVVVEYAGSGGAVAGPIANQIIRALQQEGYL